MANDFPSFQKKFDRILPKLLSKSALIEIGNIVIKNIRQRTSKSQTIGRGKVERLAPLKKSTKDKKRRDGLSTRSRLRDSGDMMRSLKTKTNFNRQQVIVEPRDSENQEKAKQAHDGSSNRKKRPFIPEEGLDKKTSKQVVNIFLRELRKQLRK